MTVESIFKDRDSDTSISALKEAETLIRSGEFKDALIIVRGVHDDGDTSYRMLHGIMSWEAIVSCLKFADQELD